MNVRELIEQAERHMPADAPPGTRHRAEGDVTTGPQAHRVAVALRIDARGRRRALFYCDGLALERQALLHLTCGEAECPEANRVRAAWRTFTRGPAETARRPRLPSAAPAVLMSEIGLDVAGHACVARPARFSCLTSCPNGAHAPLQFEQSGYDLFEDGMCIGGGVVVRGGACRPRLPSLQAAAAYVFARHLEARAILGVAADGDPSRQR